MDDYPQCQARALDLLTRFHANPPDAVGIIRDIFAAKPCEKYVELDHVRELMSTALEEGPRGTPGCLERLLTEKVITETDRRAADRTVMWYDIRCREAVETSLSWRNWFHYQFKVNPNGAYREIAFAAVFGLSAAFVFEKAQVALLKRPIYAGTMYWVMGGPAFKLMDRRRRTVGSKVEDAPVADFYQCQSRARDLLEKVNEDPVDGVAVVRAISKTAECDWYADMSSLRSWTARRLQVEGLGDRLVGDGEISNKDRRVANFVVARNRKKYEETIACSLSWNNWLLYQLSAPHNYALAGASGVGFLCGLTRHPARWFMLAGGAYVCATVCSRSY
jgi:NADH:ubiquinone oxidoreductase subunit